MGKNFKNIKYYVIILYIFEFGGKIQMNLKDTIVTIPDFPKKGIMFRDITTLLENGEAFAYTTEEIAKFAEEIGATIIVGPEARGFLFGAPVAAKLKLGFVPVRKPGKLPRKTVSAEYALEYGTNKLEITADSIVPGQKVIVVDDLLATGGTVEATVKMIEENGGIVAGIAFLIELVDLKGREKLKDYKVFTLMEY